MSVREPRRGHYVKPVIGQDTETVLDNAIASLGNARGYDWLGDAAANLHLLTSLAHEIEHRLPRAVADARDQELSWAEIADLLNVTRASAWQRYAGRTTTNRTPIEPD